MLPAKFFYPVIKINWMTENKCPVCGEHYSRKKKKGKYIYYIHYNGYEKDPTGKITKKEIYHEIKFDSNNTDAHYEFRIQKPDQNIKLRPFTDEKRFIKYIEESLDQIKKQKNFSSDKIIEVLDIIEIWLNDVINEENKKMILEKLEEVIKSLN